MKDVAMKLVIKNIKTIFNDPEFTKEKSEIRNQYDLMMQKLENHGQSQLRG
jgi:uncharacterized protein YutD